MFCLAVFSQPASSASSLWLGSFFFTAFSFFIEVKFPNFMCHMHICRLILKLTNMCFLCSFLCLALAFSLPLSLSLSSPIIHAYPALSLVRLPAKNRFKFYTKLTLCVCVCTNCARTIKCASFPKEKQHEKKRNQANLLVKMSAFAWFVCVCRARVS